MVKTTMWKILFVAIFLCPAGMVSAETVLNAVRTKVKPQIDGVLEKAWENGATIKRFVKKSGDTGPEEQTQAYFLYDDENLYIGVKCFESQLDKVKAEVTTHDGMVWTDDCVEVFIDPGQTRRKYYFFAANSIGTKTEGRDSGKGFLLSEDFDWEVKTGRGKGFWVAEFRIPLYIFNFGPEIGNTWGFNLCREQQPKSELSQWVATGPDFHNVKQFGTLAGVNIDYNRYRYQIKEAFTGYGEDFQPTLKVVIENGTGKVQALTVKSEVTFPEGNITEVAKEISLDKETLFETKIPFGNTGIYKTTISLLNKGQIICQNMFEVLPEPFFKTEFVYPPDGNVFHDNVFRGEEAVIISLKTAVQTREELETELSLMDQNKNVLATAKQSTTEKEIEVNLKLPPELGTGTYPIRARLQKGDREIARNTINLNVVEKTTTGSLVRISKDLFFEVNGQGFFPFSMYCVYDNPDLSEIADAGFNLIINYGGSYPSTADYKKFLDEAWKYKLCVLVDIPADDLAKGNVEKITKFINELKNHPAVFGWCIADEPNLWPNLTEKVFEEAVNAVKKADPYHPTWAVFAVFAPFTLGKYVDIIAIDPYPLYWIDKISGKNLKSEGAYAVAGHMDNVRKFAQGKKPIWTVNQFSNIQSYEEWPKREIADEVGRVPTLQELRCSTYISIIHGAKGLSWWNFGMLPEQAKDYPKYWEGAKALTAEIKFLMPVLLSPESKKKAEVELENDDARIDVMLKEYDGDTYIFTANPTYAESRAKITVTGLGATELRVLSEDRTVKVKKGAFIDSFEGNEVHVYTTKKDLPELALQRLLKEYREEWSRPGTYPEVPERNFAHYLNGAKTKSSSVVGISRTSAAINGGYGAYARWSPIYDFYPQWIEVEIKEEKEVAEIKIYGGGLASENYELEYWGGNGWLRVPEPTVTKKYLRWDSRQNKYVDCSEKEAESTVLLNTFSPVKTKKIRVLIKSGNPYFNEIEIFGKI